jgi:hypothetical protein
MTHRSAPVARRDGGSVFFNERLMNKANPINHLIIYLRRGVSTGVD